jgi:hypothetical protein
MQLGVEDRARACQPAVTLPAAIASRASAYDQREGAFIGVRDSGYPNDGGDELAHRVPPAPELGILRPCLLTWTRIRQTRSLDSTRVTGAQIGNRNAYTGKGFDYLGFWSISTGISLPAAIARP